MKHARLHSIIQFIEENWQESGAWPEYIEVMRQIVSAGEGEADTEDDLARPATADSGVNWVDLQALCCQAAGGDPSRTVPSAAAWYLLYAAAHVLDHLEDQDELPDALVRYSPGELINAATGLLFSASQILNGLYGDGDSFVIARQISVDFYRSVLQMAGGQGRDMRIARPSIEEWLAIAAAKSGSSFALACRSGARWGTDNLARIEYFGRFGNQLGLILQLRDDISDLSPVLLAGSRSADFDRSLAAAYARSVLPLDQQAELACLIQALPVDPDAAKDLVALLDACGTALYLQAEIERQRGIALAALQDAVPAQPAGDALIDLLDRLCKV